MQFGQTPKLAMTLLATAMIGISPAAHAGAIVDTYTGSVSGSWSDPVLSGVVIDGATRAPTFPSDNTTTAICSIASCPSSVTGGPASEILWGDILPNQLTFSGNSFSNLAPDTPFLLGTLTYFNGTTSLQSLIFGADLTLTFDITSGPGVTPKVVHVVMHGTANDGSPADNADFLTFSPDLASSLSVYESSAATADVIGEIVGDPHARLLEITLDPGSVGAGFIGGANGLPVPEPGTLSLIISGLVGFAAQGRVRRRR